MKKISDEELYFKLKELSNEIKNNYYMSNSGKAPRICTEQALELLAHYRPATKEEAKKISGIGDSFIENYGDLFINKINECLSSYSETKKYEFSNDDIVTLEKLENRLVNINGKNRLLYSSKINKDYGIDLFKLFEIDKLKEVENILLNRSNSKIELVNTNNLDDDKYIQVVRLMRTIEKNETETGNNELYLAYPFVQGKEELIDFNYKAPLILFPMKFSRTTEAIFIENDFDRDVIYNTTLILAHNKFLNKNEVLPPNSIENFDKETYLKEMIEFYENNGIYIRNNNNSNYEKFLENKKSDFPKYSKGELYLKKYFVLGLYSSYVSSMYVDFKKMIDSKTGTDLIESLICGSELLDADTSYDEKEDKVSNNKTIEDKILYINNLDSSQEKVLEDIKKYKALVVQGPPGTGKSQTITSIIIQSILSNKKVLMVSEKKTALDVIYSRLGNLSKYAVLIDDVENKTEFYNQFAKMLDIATKKNYSNTDDIKVFREDIKEKAKNIDDNILRLEEVSNSVYGINDFGTSIYKLYTECKKYNLQDAEENKIFEYLRSNFPEELNLFKYNDFKECYVFFADDNNSTLFNRYLKFYKKYHNFKKIKLNLRDYEITDLKNATNRLFNKMNELNNFNVIYRVINKKKLLSDYCDTLKKYFNINSVQEEKSLLKCIIDDNSFTEMLNVYNEYVELISFYNRLNNNKQIYLASIDKMMFDLKIDFKCANYNIKNFSYYRVIVEFEQKNSNILESIKNFESIRNDIDKNINNKKHLTEEYADAVLQHNLSLISKNGHFSKLYEVANKKRKPAISKFLNKYSFEIMESVRIWLMTPEVISAIMPFKSDLFDLVIFDEASQLYVEKAIPSIYRSKKVVVAGDKKQLKPSSLGIGRISDEIDDDDLVETSALEYESLLDAAEFKYHSTMLEYHYRSLYEELIDFSNAAFYENKLKIVSNANAPETSPIERIFVEDGRWINKQNDREADEVVKLVKKILFERQENETIGVITFNSPQMNLIEDKIEKYRMTDSKFNTLLTAEEKRFENGENKSFFVKNIETVQGDERDIIIFCVGYAKNEAGRISIQFGWLNQDGGENRLNVAISRAKKKIYVITSIEPEELVVDETKNEGPKLFKEYLKYVKAVDKVSKEEIQSVLYGLCDTGTSLHSNVNIFDSPFEEEVYNSLTERGYLVETQYGVGGYRIDMVIKDKDTKKNLLGIECDGRLYHSSAYARERDYHRQKYLESRGWKIYRIWSTNWWNNPDRELGNLINYISKIDK